MRAAWLAGLAIVLALAGCGDASTPPTAGTTPPAIESTPTETPSATPTEAPGTVNVRVVDGALDVSPARTGRGTDEAISLMIENTTADSVEVILARGKPGEDYRKIQKALVTGDVVLAGQRQLDRKRVDPGKYTLILRPVEENPSVTDTVALTVR